MPYSKEQLAAMSREELAAALGKHITEARSIQDKAGQEKRSLTGEDRTVIDRMIADADAVQSRLTELNQDEERRSKLKLHGDFLNSSRGRQTDSGNPMGDEGDGGETRNTKADLERRSKIMRRYLRYGIESLDAEQRSLLGGVKMMPTNDQGPILQAMRQDGDEEFRNLTVGTGSQGGFTVAPLFQRSMSDAMKLFQGVRAAGCEHIGGDSGADLPFPNNDDTGNVATIIGETNDHGTTTTVVGQTIVSTFMYGTGVLKCSIQLAQDSAFDIEGWLRGKLAERIGRGTNAHFTTGTGSGQPRGIVTALGTSGAGIVNTVANNAITLDEVLALQHAVDPAYRNDPSASYGLSDGILNRLRILKDSQGRYLINDATSGAPAEIWGKKYTIFTDMAASIAASTTLVLFGRFSSYKTREVGGITVFRFNELYMPNGQIGFMAFGRYGGNYVNPGNFDIKGLRTIA